MSKLLANITDLRFAGARAGLSQSPALIILLQVSSFARGPASRREHRSRPFLPFHRSCGFLMQIIVRDNNVDQALRALKKKLQREGVYREMKLRRHYEKPSEKRARERAAAVRRARKLERKRAERDGAR
jgi:small subunit ribosomal protein S21